MLTDRLQRPLRDIRISVTDRCSFRCVYCMPKEVFGRDHQFLEREQLLTFEESARLARIFASLGVRKVRITGGEPLLRRELFIDTPVIAQGEIAEFSQRALEALPNPARERDEVLAPRGEKCAPSRSA